MSDGSFGGYIPNVITNANNNTPPLATSNSSGNFIARLSFVLLAVGLCVFAYSLGTRRPKTQRVVYRFIPRDFNAVVDEDNKAVQAYEQY